jgi:hypothetical protein
MEKISRRELFERAGVGAVVTGLGKSVGYSVAPAASAASSLKPSFEWIRSVRLLIAEAYCPPFYPSLDYDAEKALAIARRLNCDSIRYPTFSYVSFFPTKTKLPHHPELGARDPFQTTMDLFHGAGLKVAAYNPLNHPFMDVRSNNPEYADWMRYGPDGKPYITSHLGWTPFYEGCLNSPLRDQVKQRVREVVTNYPVDMMYFDGPYEGMEQRLRYCHCEYCKAAYRKARGKTIPMQNGADALEDIIEYEHWMAEDVVLAFMQEICDMVRQVRDVPTVYNDTGLLGHDVRSRAYRSTDGFMFEAAETPEEKMFNMRIGQSTGKVIWTYISSHTEYNCEHLKDKSMRGWYSTSVDGERLKLDAAVATATGVGYCYWGLNRLCYSTEDVLKDPSIRGMKEVFDFAEQNKKLLMSVRPAPQAGILVGTQTFPWYHSDLFVPRSYRNYYYGAYQVLKDLGYDAEPFLDFETTADRLAKYKLVYVPNAPCLSAAQCALLTIYVEAGGTLVATHLTSVADEYGRPRQNYGLSQLLGVNFKSVEPEEHPDLYLRVHATGELIPQDPQIMSFEASPGSEVIAETYDRGQRRSLGPAVVSRQHGKSRAIYIGSGLEAVYEETLNKAIRGYFRSLLDPILAPSRTYEMDYRAGLMTQLAVSQDALLLHLIANTGNIWKKILVQEEFLPLPNVQVRLRVPKGRTAKSVTLLWSRATPVWKVQDGWVELTVPKVHPYEVVHVGLGA